MAAAIESARERPAAIAPRATYRLQLAPGFGFRDAARVVPYLAELGISHLYLSPVLQAAEGSTHGYDVVDPANVSEELGGEGGFRALIAAARAANLAILLDIVPNHMSIAGSRNTWWMDVLENGAASYYAAFFDVDWTGEDRVLLPILGERYGRALASGGLGIERNGAVFRVRAGDQHVPLSPRSVGTIARRAGEAIDHPELAYVGEALASLPASHERAASARLKRHRHRAVLLRRLDELARLSAVAGALDAELLQVNSDKVALDAILEAQNYRLAHWSVAGSQLSYRRFFDVTSLVGVRVEDPDVFLARHVRVIDWLRAGDIAGVRVDHVDGLRDPGAYLSRLREAAGPQAWIVVEKILASDEALPEAWPVDGTTGYDFADLVGRLFVDPAGEAALTRTFTEYTGDAWEPEAMRRAARIEVMSDALHAELSRVTELAQRVCATSPACRDYTRAEIEDVARELLAHMPVYRTYQGEPAAAVPRSVEARREDSTTPMRPWRDDEVRITHSGVEADRARIAHAAAAARAARPELDADLVAFLEAAFAFELPSAEAQDLARVAQQATGPVVAKGDEDTLGYRAVRLLSRCEVGADIAAFSVAPADVHAAFANRRARDMNTSSTHDTKRGEDVRARISALSELPEQWHALVTTWGERAAPGWGDVPRDRTIELAMWQTLVGAWPLSLERAQRYAEKATREARTRTSWRKQDARYEAARRAWLEHVFADAALLAEIEQFAQTLAPHGDRNSLAQLLVKLAAPGVPDFYQGAELRTATLVDPDNRFTFSVGAPSDALDRAKLHVTRRVLGLRAAQPQLFAGAYRALAATGPHAQRVFAFARGDDLVAIAPRLGVGADSWRATVIELPAGTWTDVLTERVHDGGARALAEIWRELPIALLVRSRT